jgi:HSP20 family molecular chaperone IbpA
MSIYAENSENFQVLAGIASRSMANPPWFAVPIAAEEDAEAVTVTFHVPGENQSELRIQAHDRNVTVLGSRDRETLSPVRLCSLPCPIIADQVEATRTGDRLRVRMPKNRPAAASREASSAT